MSDSQSHRSDDGDDRDPILLEREVEQDVFGERGFNIGPVMVSANPKILSGLVRTFAAITIFGSGIWLTLSSSAFSVTTQWVVVGALALIGVWTVHIVLIEVYSAGAASGFESSFNTIEQINAEGGD